MRETVNNTEIPFLEFIVIRIGATLKARTYDKSVVVYVGGVFLNRLEYKSNDIVKYMMYIKILLSLVRLQVFFLTLIM